jgi:RNA polymerase sigma factor (sigma-70 family)
MTATMARRPAAQRVDDVTDEQLLAQVAAGDRAAWGELYRRHRDAVRKYLLGKGQVEAEASDRAKVAADLDDMVQDTFLRAWTKPDDYRPELGYPVRSWLRGLAGQVAWQHRRTRGPYLIDTAGWDAIAQQRAAVVESAEEREARPLSASVRAAVQRLSPAEQRAVQLRYIDGLRGKDAADEAGSSTSSVYSHAATARRKLAAELAHQAGPAPSRYVELSRRQAAEAALDAAGDGGEPAARAWLREHGLRVSKSTVNNVARERRLVAAGRAEPVEHHDRGALTRRAEQVCRDYRDRHGRLPTDTELAQAAGVSESTARTAIGEVTGWQPRRHGTAPEIRDRTREAGMDYRARHGRLPTGAELAELAGVSDTTAHRVLREITDEPRRRGHAPQQRERAYAAARDYHDRHGRLPTGAELARATGVGEHTARTALRQLREDHTATTASAESEPRAAAEADTATEHTPDAPQDNAGRHRPRGTALGDTRPPRTDGGPEQTDREPALHRVSVTSRPTRSTAEPARPDDRPTTTVDTYASTRTTTAGPHRPPADVSIARARAAVAVMAAHRALTAQRRQAEHDHAERAARWHADDRQRTRADARSDAEGMCLQ